MLNLCDFIHVYVFTTNHHLNYMAITFLFSNTPIYREVLKHCVKIRVRKIPVGSLCREGHHSVG